MPSFDAHANFITTLVATAPSPASSGTSLVVTTIENDVLLISTVATTSASITVGAGNNQRANVNGAAGTVGQSDLGYPVQPPGAQAMAWSGLGALATWTESVVGITPYVDKTIVTNKTETGVSRITATTNKTETGVARVTATTNQTETGKASIRKNTNQTITGLLQ